MGIFDKLFKKPEPKKYLNKEEVQKINNVLSVKHQDEKCFMRRLSKYIIPIRVNVLSQGINKL
jgi:hypothetical protein